MKREALAKKKREMEEEMARLEAEANDLEPKPKVVQTQVDGPQNTKPLRSFPDDDVGTGLAKIEAQTLFF